MSDVAQPAAQTSAPSGEKRRGQGWLLLVAFVAVDFVLGAAAGIYAGMTFGAGAGTEEPQTHEASVAEEEAHAPRQDIDVGRITVVVSAADGGHKLHLLITPLVVAHPEGGEGGEEGGQGAAGGDAPAGPTAELRDAFIEYLSQLHAHEVQGTPGLALIRSELLRRTRAVAPDLHASAVLIQEFIIQ